MPGKRPASARPRNQRAAIMPPKLWVNPMVTMTMPQMTMMMGMNTEGRRRFRRMLVSGSKTE